MSVRGPAPDGLRRARLLAPQQPGVAAAARRQRAAGARVPPEVLVDDNVRSICGTELAARLDDELYAVNERLGEGAFPKTAKAYLDDWAAPANGWLRK